MPTPGEGNHVKFGIVLLPALIAVATLGACATLMASGGPAACSSAVEATAAGLLADGYQLEGAFPALGGGVVTAFTNSKKMTVKLVVYTANMQSVSGMQKAGFHEDATCRAADGGTAHLMSLEQPLPTQQASNSSPSSASTGGK